MSTVSATTVLPRQALSLALKESTAAHKCDTRVHDPLANAEVGAHPLLDFFVVRDGFGLEARPAMSVSVVSACLLLLENAAKGQPVIARKDVRQACRSPHAGEEG